MSIPPAQFEIFRGHYLDLLGQDTLWMETVEGLGAARARMAELATEKPGPYFLFSMSDGLVVAIIDTIKNPMRPPTSQSA
jgi:hypothetical protein